MASQTASVGAQFADGQAWRFVDMQRDGSQLFNSFGQARPLFVGQRTCAQMCLVNTANRANDTHGQLRGAHLHRKHCNRQAFIEGYMLGDIDGQRRFTHRRPGRQNHQITSLKAGRHFVQIVKAGRHTRHIVGVFGHLGDAVQQVHHQRVHALKALLHARALLADIEDFLLGLVQNHRHRLALRIEGVGSNLVTGGHQFTQDRALAHDFGVAADIAGTWHILRQ